jgi:hypothetical protein
VCVNGIKCSGSLEDDERKCVLQVPEQKNRQKSFKSVWPKIELLSVRMLEEITGIYKETVRKILVEDLKKKKSVCSFCSSFVKAGSET